MADIKDRLNDKRVGTVLDDTFFLSVIGKGIGGAIELTAGLLLLFISTATLHHWLEPLSRLGFHSTDHLSDGTKLFVVLYLTIRGGVRLGLAIALLREKLWAYPIALLLLISAILYQVWLMISGHYSGGLLAVTLFDLLIVALTCYEWRKLARGGHIRPHLPEL